MIERIERIPLPSGAVRRYCNLSRIMKGWKSGESRFERPPLGFDGRGAFLLLPQKGGCFNPFGRK